MKTQKLVILGAVVLVAFAGGWIWSARGGDTASPTGAVVPAANKIVMYQNPSCGCCGGWAEHMRNAGYEVEIHKTAQLNDIKRREGVYDPDIAACHTALIDGYVVEGHVPAEDVTRMLRERPDIKGISVPGMPVGSPGMETPGQPAEHYDVIAFDDAGNTSVFASH